jgi:fatty acid desaturase
MALEMPTPREVSESTRKISDILTRDELRMLKERSDWRGFAGVGFTLAVIVATAAMLVWAASQPALVAVPVFVLGLAVLGGRQLALAALQHDAAHRSLFKTQWLNEVVGDWLCARPIWNNLKKYRAHHFAHHRRTNQQDDPDLSLVKPFPTTPASLARKVVRDLLGLTGLKYLFGLVLMDSGLIKWTVANDTVWLPRQGRRWWSYPMTFFRNAAGALLANAALFAVCRASGHTWLYGVWVLSYVTPFPLFVRIRSLAEHACTEMTMDMFLNTRTTHAGLLARATVAPVRVNFHLEHHVLPGVAYYRLPLMHRMLRERGVVGEPPGYLDVLRLVSSKGAH